MSEHFSIVPLPDRFDDTEIKGTVGSLAMVPIAALRVDMTYQRNVTVASVRNIRAICRAFDWSKFLPVIVVRDGDAFSVVDGQHRATAAATLGIAEVPAYVLSCTAAEAAAAFAAINGNVTPVEPIDVWFAELAAGEPTAVAIQRCLDAAAVKLTRRKEGHGVGETRSIGVIRRAYEFYGPALLITILQCITESASGNAGLIVGAVVNGIGRAIRTKPEALANPGDLLRQDRSAFDPGVREGGVRPHQAAGSAYPYARDQPSTAVFVQGGSPCRMTVPCVANRSPTCLLRFMSSAAWLWQAENSRF
jgi:ParB-like nuclease domain